MHTSRCKPFRCCRNEVIFINSTQSAFYIWPQVFLSFLVFSCLTANILRSFKNALSSSWFIVFVLIIRFRVFVGFLQSTNWVTTTNCIRVCETHFFSLLVLQMLFVLLLFLNFLFVMVWLLLVSKRPAVHPGEVSCKFEDLSVYFFTFGSNFGYFSSSFRSFPSFLVFFVFRLTTTTAAILVPFFNKVFYNLFNCLLANSGVLSPCSSHAFNCRLFKDKTRSSKFSKNRSRNRTKSCLSVTRRPCAHDNFSFFRFSCPETFRLSPVDVATS